MEEEKIYEILNDPNTWDWDGCSYSENGNNMGYLDNVFDDIFKKAKELQGAQNTKAGQKARL